MDLGEDLDPAPFGGREKSVVTVAEWSRVKELFEATLALPVGQRDAFLQSRADAPAIRDEVHSLLAVYEASPDFLEGAGPELPAAPPPRLPDAPLAGRRM